MTIQLYCFGESGNAYKAALTLELSGLAWEPVYVDFFKGAARTEEFQTGINAMGEVPALVDGEFSLSQSGAIQHYVTEKSGKLGGAAQDRFEILRWQFWDNHKMSSQAGITRFLLNYLPEDKRQQQAGAVAFLQGRLKAAYGVLDAHLAGRNWVVGDMLSIADLSCCGYLFYPEEFGFSRADWPNIDAWLSRIADTPGWKHPYDLMPPAWPENQKG